MLARRSLVGLPSSRSKESSNCLVRWSDILDIITHGGSTYEQPRLSVRAWPSEQPMCGENGIRLTGTGQLHLRCEPVARPVCCADGALSIDIACGLQSPLHPARLSQVCRRALPHSVLPCAQVVRDTSRTTRHSVVLRSAITDGVYAEWFTNVSASMTSMRVTATKAQLRGQAQACCGITNRQRIHVGVVSCNETERRNELKYAQR